MFNEFSSFIDDLIADLGVETDIDVHLSLCLQGKHKPFNNFFLYDGMLTAGTVEHIAPSHDTSSQPLSASISIDDTICL